MTQTTLTSRFVSRFAIAAAMIAVLFAIGASRAEANSITIGVSACDSPPKVSVYGNEYYWGPFCTGYGAVMRWHVYDAWWNYKRGLVCLKTGPWSTYCYWD